MKIFIKFKNIIGYIICIFSVITGGIATGYLYEDFSIGFILTYLVFGLLPFWLGLLIVNGKEMLKLQKGQLFPLRLYLFFSVITPLLINIVDDSSRNKISLVSSPNDVYLQLMSQEWMGYVMVFAGILAYFPAMYLFINGWKTRERHIKWMFFISLAVAVTFGFITRDDYQAVRTDGIVVSKHGEKEEIPWSEIDTVDIDGQVSSDGFHRTSTSSFKWSFYFRLQDGRTIEMGDLSYNKYNLKDSLAIKKVLKDHKIPWKVYGLSEREWEFVEVDMDYEEADSEDFYRIFQYDPETREPYDVPFE
ncbi:hypothetical protein [Mesobacillus thioparans]|uniref:hypothetical protein n=1 Tax=Mesobacillus thioparans TaxID=370439 RepID=UPI0039EE010B